MNTARKLFVIVFCLVSMLEFSSCNYGRYRNFYVTKSRFILPHKAEEILPEGNEKDIIFVRHYHYYLPKSLNNSSDTVKIKKYANKVFRKTHELDWKVFNLSHGCKISNYEENSDINFNFFVRPIHGFKTYKYERKHNRICYKAQWNGK
jgi:hypothetical protein